MADARADFEARSEELAGRATDPSLGAGEREQAAALVGIRAELGAYVDGLAERVAAVEALGAEARQAIANAHEVEEHYDELRRRLLIVAHLLGDELDKATLDLVQRVLEVPVDVL